MRGRGIAIAAVVVCCAHGTVTGVANGAVASTVAVQGSISTGGTSIQTLPGNTKDGTTPTFALLSNGDESIANSTLAATAGELTADVHACSGPPEGNPNGSGNARSQATANYAETFTIASDTLAMGTPVTIRLKVAAARSYRSNVVQPFPIQAGQAAVNGSAYVGYNTENELGHLSGGFSSSQAATGPVNFSTTGIFATPLVKPGAKDGDPNAMESVVTVGGTVGGHFSLDIETQVGATSDGLWPIITDGDGQITLTWGADVIGGLAQLQTSDGTGTLPGTATSGSDRALADLPPAPIETTPEPAALAPVAAVVIGLMRRRRGLRTED